MLVTGKGQEVVSRKGELNRDPFTDLQLQDRLFRENCLEGEDTRIQDTSLNKVQAWDNMLEHNSALSNFVTPR